MNSKHRSLIIFIACSFSMATALHADDAAPATQPGDQAALEQAFEQTMTNAVLAGRFTIDGDDKAEKEDHYTINSVKKLAGDLWVFNARIQYGAHDITVPLILPVKWAGDTPVISLTHMGVPGIGTFSARVVIYIDHYSGVWSGGPTHQGTLSGRIEHPATQPATGSGEGK